MTARIRKALERRRRWIKLYPVECITGSIRWQLTPDERGVWYDLLCLSAMSSLPGIIADRDGRALPHDFIASQLFVPLEMLERTLSKCIDEGRITEDDGGIHINNWSYYQSEYERVKGYQQVYRQKKSIPQKFEIFWKAYPKRKSKGQAEKAFAKINPDEQLLATMLATIEQAIKSVDWQKDDGKFIPYPATWLNAKGWEDEFPKEGKGGTHKQSSRELKSRNEYKSPEEHRVAGGS